MPNKTNIQIAINEINIIAINNLCKALKIIIYYI